MDKHYCFSSKRLAFRGIDKTDAEQIVRWRSDPNNYRWFFRQEPVSLESHLKWFENYLLDATRFDFMIVDSTGEPIGTCGLSGITDDSCEVSYMIGERTARGQGYASEAVRAMCMLAFEHLGVKSIYARIRSGNNASVHVAEAAGLVESERIYELVREDYRDTNTA